MSKEVLRQFIREAISSGLTYKVGEKLKKAQEGKLGFYIKRYPSKVSVTLYDTGKLIELCRPPIEDDDGLYHFAEVAPQTIVAYIELLEAPGCGGGMEVTTSAAKDKFGPLIYDFAMAASPAGIVPDRQAISAKARDMYKNMFDSRPDVSKTPVPEKCRTWVRSESQFLDYTYSGGTRLDVSELESNHQKAMAVISEMLDVEIRTLESQISVAGWKSADLDVKVASKGEMYYSG
jgi:hypothetical protein